MSPPTRINVSGGYYDLVNGLCYPDPAPVCEASADSNVLPSVTVLESRTPISRSVLLADAFGSGSRRLEPPRLWSEPSWQFSPVGAVTSMAGCSSAPDDVPVPGDPISDVTSLASETSLTGTLHGKVRGVEVSSAASHSSVVYSSFDGTHPSESGTFAYLRTGTSGGTLYPAIPDSSSIHQSTTGASLDNGETVALYARVTGEEEPTSLIARRISSSGTPVGSEISVLAAAIRPTFPQGQVVALSSGFVAVYQDGDGHFKATRFDQNGGVAGSIEDLGPVPSLFRLTRGEGDSWALAQASSGSQIRVRTFEGIDPTGVDASVNMGGFPSTPSLAVAMQDDGSMMLAYNVLSGGINATLLSPAGSVQTSDFRVSSSGLANTVALASDHRGNFVLAWEQAGAILGRIYNGTNSYSTPASFSAIATGSTNSDIHATVSADGILSLVWTKSSTDASGAVLLDIMRRDFRISYAP